MTEHILKTIEPYFSAVASGDKTFEIRRNDRAFQKGDTLILLDTSDCDCDKVDCSRRRKQPIRKTITFVFAGDPSLRDLGGVLPGHVILGLADPETNP